MRWEERLLALFDDLEQQAEGLALSERDVEVAELGRAEYARVELIGRLHASRSREVRLEVLGHEPVRGTVARVGADWCLLTDGAQEWLVPVAAVTGAGGLSERAVGEEARPLGARLGLGSALRGLAEGRRPVVVDRVDGRRLRGTLGRVGADFVELWSESESPGGDTCVLLPFAAIAAVRDG